MFDQSTTILGCTLWTAILPDQAVEAYKRLTDFNEERGIREWSIERRFEAHREDLAWLNAQVNDIRETEPLRQIIIATQSLADFGSEINGSATS